MLHRSKRWVIFILVILAGLCLYGYVHKKHFHGKANAATEVITVKPQRLLVTNSTAIIGSVVSTQQTNITPKLAGYISAILFTEGQFVKAGAPLIQLDNTKLKAQVAADKTNYHINDKQYQVYKAAFKKGLITKADMENEHTQSANSSAQLTQDEELLDQTTLRAPFDGYLGAKSISVGDYVNQAQPLVTLVDRDHLQVEYNLQEKYSPWVSLGQTVDIINQLDQSDHFKAIITYVAPNIEPTTRTLAIHAKIDDPTHQLLPGQYVLVTQELGKPYYALFIPEEAVLVSLEGSAVYIDNHGIAKEVTVTLGKRQNGFVEIKKGLEKNSLVIKEGQEKLQDGQAIRSVRQPA